MHVVILGCGRVGSTLANSLEERGHQVSIIDQAGDAFRRLGPTFEGRTVTGVGFDPDVLEEAGIQHAGAFAAVSSGDNSNIIASRVAREQYGVQTVAARIYDQGRAEVYERLGIPTVATVRWTADQLRRRILPEGSESEWVDPSGEIRLAEVHVDRAWRGRTVGQLETAAAVRVAFLTRLGKGMLPTSETVIQDGDLVHVVMTVNDSATVTELVTRPPEA